jgi:glycosyltransferase involved in cell wall biosynthesis
MQPPILIVGPGRSCPGADAVRRIEADLEAAGMGSIHVDGPQSAADVPRALFRARRAARRSGAESVVTVSPPGASHAVGRALSATGMSWIAHLAEPLDFVPSGRWARELDPRVRALRAAPLLTAAPLAGEQAHREFRAAVAGEGPSEALSARAASWPRDDEQDGRSHDLSDRPGKPDGRPRSRILMLGTLNTPHVEHLALQMRDRGHDVYVGGEVTPGYPPSLLPAAGVPVTPLQLPALLWIRRLLGRVRPDVVHAHWLSAYGFLAAISRARPLIVMAWGSDVYAATPRQLRQCRFALRHADVAMTDSQDLLDRLIELGARPERTHLLNWGVDLEAFAPAPDRVAVRRLLGLGDGPLVLSPRALTPLYNPRVILDAFEQLRARVPDAQLVLKHIGESAPDLGRPLPDGARIIGHVPYELMPEYYRAADVCVSIPDSDSSPRSVWEAMACGCPCVISDLPWARELIEDGRHALLAAPYAGPVSAALERVLTDAQFAARIGGEARRLVEMHRDQVTEMDRLSALYERLATGLPAATTPVVHRAGSPR